MAGKPFEQGKLGVQVGVDPHTLSRGDRTALDSRRLAHQQNLLRRGVKRFTLIEVNENGRIYDGHHGVRAAIDLDLPVDVKVVQGIEPPAGLPTVEGMPVR